MPGCRLPPKIRDIAWSSGHHPFALELGNAPDLPRGDQAMGAGGKAVEEHLDPGGGRNAAHGVNHGGAADGRASGSDLLDRARACTRIDEVDFEPLRSEEALLPGNDRRPDGDADPDHDNGNIDHRLPE